MKREIKIKATISIEFPGFLCDITRDIVMLANGVMQASDLKYELIQKVNGLDVCILRSTMQNDPILLYIIERLMATSYTSIQAFYERALSTDTTGPFTETLSLKSDKWVAFGITPTLKLQVSYPLSLDR